MMSSSDNDLNATASLSASSTDEMSTTTAATTTTGNNSSTDLQDAFEIFDTHESHHNSQVSIKQYAQNVVDFSSQYGSDYSISYTAVNITGRPSKFPDYGDFPETYCMRSYGEWWERAPSRLSEIQPQNLQNYPSQDFITVRFEQFVLPEKVSICETYNPGAIVRIWAYTFIEKWVCLWEGLPQKCLPMARVFSPPIKKILIPTNAIRLEFNHSHLDYFTEIDSITLIGKKCHIVNPEITYRTLTKKGPILKKLESIKFRPSLKENHQAHIKDFIINDLEKFIRQTYLIADGKQKESTQLNLKHMPSEILLKIFSYLDLISLFRVGKVCKLMYEISTHPLLYSEINLRPYWHLANSDLLSTLAKRCRLLKKLDLSWCGTFGAISSTEFTTFIQSIGENLTNIRLYSCKFLTTTCVETIGIICNNLKELSIHNYSLDPSIIGFSFLTKLKNLERLDLCRTFIGADLLLVMIQNNPQLKHLNLAFSGIGINMDDVARQVSKYNKNLISVDLWKSHGLSSVGLQALSACHNLEEVDFGWCLREEASPGESLKCLLKGCPKLKKLFLAAIRGITDRDVENIASLCPNLEQLDLMGVLGISTERCYELLTKCNKLQLLDLSFCDNIDESKVNIWRGKFNVDIKRSVPSDVQ